MARQKKDGVNINYFIRRDVKERLDTYCEEVGQTATMAIERILDDYLTKYYDQKSKGHVVFFEQEAEFEANK